MKNQSFELKWLTQKCYEAMTNCDLAFIENIFSKEEDVLLIGTDPYEWWQGYETVIGIFCAQFDDLKGCSIYSASTQAICLGDVGWVADHITICFSDGLEIPMRITLVFAKEDEGWKVRQWHNSVGMFNQEILGQSTGMPAF